MAERTAARNPADAFARLLEQPVKYLPHSLTTAVGWDAGSGLECARTLVWRVAARCFATTNGTFGGVALDEFAAGNLSVALFLQEMMRRTGVSTYWVTLYNEESMRFGDEPEVVGYLLVAPLSFEDYIPFYDHARAHLWNDELTVDKGDADDEDEPARPRAGRPKKKKTKVTSTKGDPPRGSWRHVTSERVLLEIVRRQSLQAADPAFTLEWDGVLAEAAGGDPDEVMTLLRMFDAEEHFANEANQSWYSNRGVPAWQRSADTYFDRGVFDPPASEVYADVPWAMRAVHKFARCMCPDADALLGYMLPNNDVPLELLRGRLSANDKYLGQDIDERIECLDDEDTLALLEGNDAPYRKYGNTIVISGPHPFKNQETTLYSEQWQSKLYPVMFHTMLKNRSAKRALAAQYAADAGQHGLVRRAHMRVTDDVSATLTEAGLGTVPYYAAVWNARLRMGRRIAITGVVAKHARAIHDYDPARASTAGVERQFDRDLASLADAITMHMGVTPQQLRIVLTCLMTVCASAEHEFGDQFALALFGESDVGKSYAMQIVCCLLDTSMQEQQNDSSDKAWVLDGVMPFLFTWLDEVGIGLSASSKSASKDSKNMQSGMSTGVMSYKQYTRGAEGEDDFLLLRHVDCRKNWALTSNVMVNKAMQSRLDVRHQWDGHNDPGTKSKIATASCARDGPGEKGCAQAVAFMMSGSAYMWNARANGAYAVPLDFRMMEIFTSLYVAMLVPAGFPKLKCRDVNRHKHVAKGIFNFTTMNALYRDPANAAIARSKERELAYFLVRGAVVPMRAVEVAFNLNMPCRKFAALETRTLSGIATMMAYTVKDSPVEDKDRAYYGTTITKRDAAQRVAQSTRLAGHDTADDIVATALTKLECTKRDGMPIVKYEQVNYTDTLFVLAAAIHDVDVQTDHMSGLYEWLRHASQNETMQDLRWVCVDVHEEHYLFSRKVVDTIRGEASLQVLDQMPESMALLSSVGTDVSRRRALHAVLQATLVHGGSDAREPVASEQTGADTEYPYMGMLFVENWQHNYQTAQPCKAGGEYAGQRFTPAILSGALRVNKRFLDNYRRGEAQDKGTGAALEEFRAVLAAISGESAPGEMCYRSSAGTIDGENSSNEMSRTAAPTSGEWTYTNPREMAKSDIIDPTQYFLYDTVHPENARTITLRAGDNLYKQMCEERARENCYGMSVREWEDMYELPHMFP